MSIESGYSREIEIYKSKIEKLRRQRKKEEVLRLATVLVDPVTSAGVVGRIMGDTTTQIDTQETLASIQNVSSWALIKPDKRALLYELAEKKDWAALQAALAENIQLLDPNFVHPDRVRANIQSRKLTYWNPDSNVRRHIPIDRFPLHLTKFIRGPKVELGTSTSFGDADVICVDGVEFVDRGTKKVLNDGEITSNIDLALLISPIYMNEVPKLNLPHSDATTVHVVHFTNHNEGYEIGYKLLGNAEFFEEGPWVDLAKGLPQNQHEEFHPKGAIVFSIGAIIQGR